MSISKNRSYQTTSGHPVLIYATMGGGPFPIHGAILVRDEWHLAEWTACGQNKFSGANNLIEITETESVVRWAALADGRVHVFDSKETAQQTPGVYAVKKLELTFIEGEGLE